MQIRLPWWLALALLFVLSSACAPIHYGQQELFLRHDAKADKLDLLIVYDAIQVEKQDDEDGRAIGRNFAKHVSGGRREAMIFDWPFHFDLDQLLQQDEARAQLPLDPMDDWKHELLMQAKALKVFDSGYCAGLQGRLALYQALRITDAKRLVNLFERLLYVAINESVEKGRFEADTPWLDARSRELWIAMTREKHRWLSLEEGVLTVELPLTNASAARVLAESEKFAAEDPVYASMWRGLLSHLTELRVADEHVVLHWKLEGPTWTFAASKALAYDDSLAKSLRESKSSPEKLPARDEVIERFCKR